MNLPKRDELLLRTVLALPKLGLSLSSANPILTEAFEDRISLDDLIFEGDGLLSSSSLLLTSTDIGEVGNDLRFQFLLIFPETIPTFLVFSVFPAPDSPVMSMD